MNETQKNVGEYYTIDIVHIFKTLWSRIWIILLAGVLAAVAGFSIASFAIVPQYSSSVLLYVNNSSVNLGSTSFSISASDISASHSLVKTYTELLKNRTTLGRVIEKADVSYTYSQLYNMIEAGSSNDTQIMKVTVTCANPYEASKIANTIAEVLPTRVSEIIDGASMEVVDSAVPQKQKVSPSITRYTFLGLFLGCLLTAAVIAVMVMMDDTIHDEEYIIQTYGYPILAKVPNLLNTNSKPYGFYQKPTSNARH